MSRQVDYRSFLRIPVMLLMVAVGVPGLISTASGQVGFTDEQFEQWVFQQYGNAATARTMLKESMKLYTDDIDLTCGLSDAQRRKLRLAGQGDIERFFREFEAVKAEFQAARNDQQKVNGILQDVSAVQSQMAAGLFDRDSLLQKTLVNTLSREQFLQYVRAEEERRRFHHESKIMLVIAMLDQSAPLTAAQRQQLTELLRRETEPLRKPTQYDYYVMMYQVSKIPEERFKRIFDDIQWQVFSVMLGQMHGMEEWLEQNGLLADAVQVEERLLPDEQVAVQ